MALIILPLLTYYLIVNKLPYKRINNQSHVIWATKVSFILLISNALYYLCYLFHKTNKTFHQANWYYLAVVILIVVSL